MFRSPPIIESQYFPIIPFFVIGVNRGTLFLEAQEHYQKGGFRNKTTILTADGLKNLSIPLQKGKHQQLPIKEVKIDSTENWQRVHWFSIKTAYGKSPYFLHYEETIHSIFKKKYHFLYDLNLDIIHDMVKILQLPIVIQETQEFVHPQQENWDFRNFFRPSQWNEKGWQPLPYPQVFQDRNGFIGNAGILDILFCLGPEALTHLLKEAEINKKIMEPQ